MDPLEVVEMQVTLTVPGEKWSGYAVLRPPERHDKWPEWQATVVRLLMPSVVNLVPFQADFKLTLAGAYRTLKGPQATAMLAHFARVDKGENPPVVWTPVARVHPRLTGGVTNGEAN